MEKRMDWFSMIPLCVCLLSAFLPAAYMAAGIMGYDLTFYNKEAAILVLTIEITVMLAILVFSKRKLNRFGEVCACLMPLTVIPCSVVFWTIDGQKWMFLAGLWLIGWTAATFKKRTAMMIVGCLGIAINVLAIFLAFAYVSVNYSTLRTEPTNYVYCVSPDGSEMAEAYFWDGLPHLKVYENNDGIDLKIARLEKKPIFIDFGGSTAIQSIEWKDENTLWIDNEAAYPIER